MLAKASGGLLTLCTSVFLYNSLFHRAFRPGSFGEELERVSLLPIPALQQQLGRLTSTFQPVTDTALWFCGSERGRNLPCALLSMPFPLRVYKRLLHITQMKNSLVLS